MKFTIEFNEELARAEITYPNGAVKRYLGVSITVTHPVEIGLDIGETVFQPTRELSFTFKGTEIK